MWLCVCVCGCFDPGSSKNLIIMTRGLASSERGMIELISCPLLVPQTHTASADKISKELGQY